MKTGTALAVALAVALASAAEAQDRVSPLPRHLPLGQEACFGRVYDAAHLKKHPKQRVTAFHLFRDFTPDPNMETMAETREKLVARDGEHHVVVKAYLRFRDRKRLFTTALSCSTDQGIVHCGIECDGGGFRLQPSGESLLVQNQGFVVSGGCGSDESEEEKRDFVKPGADDKVFRLDPLPLAQCRSIEDSRKPFWAALGRPLRERLNTEDAVCFSRVYDAAHLAKHPQQRVRRMAVLKMKGDVVNKGDDPHHNLVFRAELTDGKRLEKRTSCSADRYAFTCTHDPQFDTQQDFFLTRASGERMMLRDPSAALSKMFETKLGSDDRLFSLQQSPEQACAF